MSNFESKYIVCPFYCRCERNRIICEGIDAKTRTHLVFSSAGERLEYQTAVCCDMEKHTSCPLDRMLEEKWGMIYDPPQTPSVYVRPFEARQIEARRQAAAGAVGTASATAAGAVAGAKSAGRAGTEVSGAKRSAGRPVADASGAKRSAGRPAADASGAKRSAGRPAADASEAKRSAGRPVDAGGFGARV